MNDWPELSRLRVTSCFYAIPSVLSCQRGRALKHVNKLLLSLALLLCVFSLPESASAQNFKSALFKIYIEDRKHGDFARTLLEIEKLIDPGIDVEANLAEINALTARLQSMIPPKATSREKLRALQTFIYEPGPWNEGREFSYDLDDPNGDIFETRLLSTYLRTRKGNCVTMPFLVIVLGQRIGLNVTAATAPLHILVKFTDDDGKTYNLEATSGARGARDAHYRNLFPITDRAIESGLYLDPLNREEMVGLATQTLVDHLLKEGRYEDAMPVSDIILHHYPAFGLGMVKKATAAYHILKRDFYDKYPDPKDVPRDRHDRVRELQAINTAEFDKAEALGWKPHSR